MTSFETRAYDAAKDEEAVCALWRETLGERWPLSRETFRRVTVESGAYQPGDHLVAVSEGRIVGFVATQARGDFGGDWLPGEVMLLMVASSHRRRRIGETLLEMAKFRLMRRGVRSAQLGAGGVSYFWPGVPTNLEAAWPFFEACGLSSDEMSYDLIRPLKDYETPPGIFQNVQSQGIRIAAAASEDREAILEFARRHFPMWRIHYEKAVVAEAFGDVLLAKEADGSIAGATLILDPRSEGQGGGFVWSEIFGERTGRLGVLGVAGEKRERGIGIALAARATEILKERGVETSFVGYTWLTEWYGKLGYEVWREYRMSRSRQGGKYLTYQCAADSFRPARSSYDVRWIEIGETNPGAADAYWAVPLTRDDWFLLKRDGYRFCAAFDEGRIVSLAAVWKCEEDAWEVSVVATAPEARRRGFAQAVVSFVTAHILENGRTALCRTLESNRPMRRTAESLGFALAVHPKDEEG
jgi:beta-N-acetylhexosaminidase